MMRGTVNLLCEVIVPLRLRGVSGIEMVVDAVLDTGFTDELTLPAVVIGSLGLQRITQRDVTLADGSARFCNIYPAEVAWDGAWRSILVLGLGDETLMGMKMIEGHTVRIDAVIGGTVEIIPIP